MSRPWIIIHSVLSVDGRLTTARGLRTRWEKIAPEAIQEFYRLGHHLGSQGVLISSSTLRVTEEALAGMTPEEGRKRPALIVTDNHGRINWTLMKRMPWLGEVIVLCSQATPQKYLDYLQEEGVHAIITGHAEVDLTLAMEQLWVRYRIGMIQCQGGGALNGHMLRRGLVDELSLVMAPLAIGGTKTPTLFDAEDLDDMGEITNLRLTHCQGLGGGVLWLRYEVVHAGDES